MTADLIAFIGARLDDDAVAARDAKPGPWHADGGGVCATHPTDQVVDYSESADHIARHDPARALREVEAKRLLLVKLAEWYSCGPFTDSDVDLPDAVLVDAAAELLPLFALPYADHPDYREEWRS